MLAISNLLIGVLQWKIPNTKRYENGMIGSKDMIVQSGGLLMGGLLLVVHAPYIVFTSKNEVDHKYKLVKTSPKVLCNEYFF